jgi:hypothetical protein
MQKAFAVIHVHLFLLHSMDNKDTHRQPTGSMYQRRNFFDGLALDLGFNPLDAENWYKITPEDVKKRKVSY